MLLRSVRKLGSEEIKGQGHASSHGSECEIEEKNSYAADIVRTNVIMIFLTERISSYHNGKELQSGESRGTKDVKRHLIRQYQQMISDRITTQEKTQALVSEGLR